MFGHLHQNLKNHQLKEKPIISDNNCQFHAVIDQCLQNGIVGWTHVTLRSASVEWLKQNKDLKVEDIPLSELLSLNDAHIIGLQQHSKVWGDEATLFAMAQILNAKIMVYSSLKVGDVYTILPIGNAKYTFHIGYYNNIHYVSTIPCAI